MASQLGIALEEHVGKEMFAFLQDFIIQALVGRSIDEITSTICGLSGSGGVLRILRVESSGTTRIPGKTRIFPFDQHGDQAWDHHALRASERGSVCLDRGRPNGPNFKFSRMTPEATESIFRNFERIEIGNTDFRKIAVAKFGKFCNSVKTRLDWQQAMGPWQNLPRLIAAFRLPLPKMIRPALPSVKSVHPSFAGPMK